MQGKIFVIEKQLAIVIFTAMAVLHKISFKEICLKMIKFSQLTGFEGGEPNIDEPKPESAKLMERLERFRSGVVNTLLIDGHWKWPLYVTLLRAVPSLCIACIFRSST